MDDEKQEMQETQDEKQETQPCLSLLRHTYLAYAATEPDGVYYPCVVKVYDLPTAGQNIQSPVARFGWVHLEQKTWLNSQEESIVSLSSAALEALVNEEQRTLWFCPRYATHLYEQLDASVEAMSSVDMLLKTMSLEMQPTLLALFALKAHNLPMLSHLFAHHQIDTSLNYNAPACTEVGILPRLGESTRQSKTFAAHLRQFKWQWSGSRNGEDDDNNDAGNGKVKKRVPVSKYLLPILRQCRRSGLDLNAEFDMHYEQRKGYSLFHVILAGGSPRDRPFKGKGRIKSAEDLELLWFCLNEGADPWRACFIHEGEDPDPRYKKVAISPPPFVLGQPLDQDRTGFLYAERGGLQRELLQQCTELRNILWWLKTDFCHVTSLLPVLAQIVFAYLPWFSVFQAREFAPIAPVFEQVRTNHSQ